MGIENRSELAPVAQKELEEVIEAFATLEDVVRWDGHRIDEVIVQDEYTLDVVVGWSHNRYLVFDTT